MTNGIENFFYKLYILICDIYNLLTRKFYAQIDWFFKEITWDIPLKD